jgi:hypothetical protein
VSPTRCGVSLFEAETTYRVQLFPDGGVSVLCFGTGPVGKSIERGYTAVEETPQWMQDALHVLRILHEPPPVCDIPGVGKRMGTDLYWVYGEGKP